MDTALEPCVASEDDEDDDEIDDIEDSDQQDDASEEDGEDDASEDGEDDMSQDGRQDGDEIDDEINDEVDSQGEQCERPGACVAYNCDIVNRIATYTAERVEAHNEKRDLHVDTNRVTANLDIACQA